MSSLKYSVILLEDTTKRGYMTYNIVYDFNLKVWHTYFQQIWDGEKLYEVRKMESLPDVKLGDIIRLSETVNGTVGKNSVFTGRTIVAAVTNVLTHEQFDGVSPGYCIVGIKVIDKS